MTTPASGAIALTDIQTEFGGTNPIDITEYYAGAGLVPAGTTGGNGSDGVASNTVIPSSGQIKFANFYNAAAVVLQSSMTFDGVSIDYTPGKKFEWYKTDTQNPSPFNITVTQDITATVTLVGGAGRSNAGSLSGGAGGSAHTLIFTFTFKAGQTYVLKLGGAGQGGSSPGQAGQGQGGGYSALYLGSVAPENLIALAAGGGGGGYSSAVTASSTANGGPGGGNTSVAVTNGLAWAGQNGGTGAGAGGATGTAGGTTVGTTGPGTAGSFLTGGSGGQNGAYTGGGGGAGYYGGAGGQAGNSASTIGGGGGGSSFAYTANDGSGKTVSNVSVITGTRATVYLGNAARPITGIAGQSGAVSNAANSYPLHLTLVSMASWRRPYPGGTISTNFLNWDCVLAAPYVPGDTSFKVAWRVYTQVARTASQTQLQWTNDPRRLVSTNYTCEFTVNGITYVRTISSSTATITTLTAPIGVDLPAGTELLIYPSNSTDNTVPGAFRTGLALGNATRCFFRVQQADGTWFYGITGTTFSGGNSTPISIDLLAPMYPLNTIPKGALVQRGTNANADTDTSIRDVTSRGGMTGAVMLQFS